MENNKGSSYADFISIAVCDDEIAVRNRFEKSIKRIFPNADVLKFASGDELINCGRRFDILLLDIQLPGTGGMETARSIREKYMDAVIIFITAYPDYVFEAFDVEAFNYLVKPVREERLASVLKAAADRVKALRRDDRYIMVQSRGEHIKVFISDIVYAEVFNRIVIIHTVKGDVRYYGRLSELAENLGENFFQTHRAYLINFAYVTKYSAAAVTMNNTVDVLLAKAKFSDFVQRYLEYNKRKGLEMQ